jgi:hypothetical protein
MFGFRYYTGRLGVLQPALALVATLATFAGGVSLLAVPVVRAAEAGESSGSHERSEDPTLTSRFEHDRLVALASRVSAFVQPARPLLGHAQRPVLEAFRGHRLANGLLAPMIC